MIASFKTDIALWGIPANNSIYRIDRIGKTMTLIYGPCEVPGNGDMFLKISAVCAHLGYTAHLALGEAKMSRAEADQFGQGKTVTRFVDPGSSEAFMAKLRSAALGE